MSPAKAPLKRKSTKSKAPPLPRAQAPHATGRLPVDIDPETVRKLAGIDCSYAEMAAILNCDESTLTRRFAQVIQKGREEGRASLKRRQFELAMAGNPTMLIWLGKQRLGQADKQEHSGPGGDAIPHAVAVTVTRRIVRPGDKTERAA